MSDEITVAKQATLSAILRERLLRALPEGSGVTLNLRCSDARARNIDATVVVAAVGAGGASMAALFGGILKLLEKAREQHIRITGASGRSVEIVGKPSEHLLQQCIEAARELDAVHIEVE